jgi:NADH-quinone oxidoreductase subunit E
MAHIRALEVATFYFMFQLAPVGSVAHIQICGTTSCMICGAEDLVAVCKDKIAEAASAQRRWQVLVGRGRVPRRLRQRADGPDRQGLLRGPDGGEAGGAHRRDGGGKGAHARAAERALRVGARLGLTSLTEYEAGKDALNVSARLATDIGDTIKRIDGTEVPLLAPWGKQSGGDAAVAERPAPAPKAAAESGGETGPRLRRAETRRPAPAAEAVEESAPEQLTAARDGKPDDLKRISGVGPKLEGLLNEMGFYHFDQIAAWTPAEVAWVDARLKFKGRIERDDWIAQAGACRRGLTPEVHIPDPFVAPAEGRALATRNAKAAQGSRWQARRTATPLLAIMDGAAFWG